MKQRNRTTTAVLLTLGVLIVATAALSGQAVGMQTQSPDASDYETANQLAVTISDGPQLDAETGAVQSQDEADSDEDGTDVSENQQAGDGLTGETDESDQQDTDEAADQQTGDGQSEDADESDDEVPEENENQASTGSQDGASDESDDDGTDESQEQQPDDSQAEETDESEEQQPVDRQAGGTDGSDDQEVSSTDQGELLDSILQVVIELLRSALS